MVEFDSQGITTQVQKCAQRSLNSQQGNVISFLVFFDEPLDPFKAVVHGKPLKLNHCFYLFA